MDLGSEAGEPVWKMKVFRMRWRGVSSYFEEAQRARKFSAVLGTDSQKISSLRSPSVVWSCGCVSCMVDCGGKKWTYCDGHDVSQRNVFALPCSRCDNLRNLVE